MKLTLVEPKLFKDSVMIISELVNEARFKITKEGVELVAMDPANVAMVIFKLLSSTFTEYSLKEPITICVNLESVKQILRRIASNDTMTLELDDKSKLVISLRGTTTRTFSIPLIDLDEKEQRIPDLKFHAVIKTDSAILNGAIEDADIVAESVSFIAEPGRLCIQAEGDLSKALIEIKEGDDTSISLSESSKIRAKYSIEYLKRMINGSKLASKVIVYFSKDYPLKLEFTAVDKVSLSFILAPRVEND